jgi:hypothetical protein
MTSRLLRALALLAVVLSGLAIAACGEDKSGSAKAGADPASIAPTGSPLYLEAAIRPQGGQKDALDKLIGKVAGGRDLGRDIRRAIDKSLESDPKTKGRSFGKDIDPWLGDRAAIFVASLDPATLGAAASGAHPDVSSRAFPYAAAIATKDAGKAADELNSIADQDGSPKATYKNVGYRTSGDVYFAVVGDFLVIGSKKGLQAAIDVDKGAPALERSAAFKEATDTLPAERLGYGYADGRAFVDAIVKSGALPARARKTLEGALGSGKRGAVTFSAVARDDGLLVEGQTPAPVSGAKRSSALLGALPGDAWLAFAAPDLGASIQHAITAFSRLGGAAAGNASPDAALGRLKRETGFDVRRDLASWAGDVAFFASGTSLLNLSAGAVLQSKDTAASARALRKLRGLAARLGASKNLSVKPAPGGFSLAIPGAPAPVTAAQRGNRVVIAYGPDAVTHALSAPRKLSGAGDFKAARAALGSGFGVSGYVDFQPILALAEGLGASSDAQYKSAKPYLDALDAIVFGSKVAGDKSLTRLLLKVR